MKHVEFTIEPFVDGEPGPHVLAPQEALTAEPVEVEIGPFGTSVRVDDDRVATIVATVVEHAFANGATHVRLDISEVEP